MTVIKKLYLKNFEKKLQIKNIKNIIKFHFIIQKNKIQNQIILISFVYLIFTILIK